MPAGLYQAQQKLNKKKHAKKRGSRHSSRTSTTSDKTDSQSLRSSIYYGESMRSLPETPENQSLMEAQGAIVEPITNTLEDLDKSTGFPTSSVGSRLQDFELGQINTPTSLSAMKLNEQGRRTSLASTSSEFARNRQDSSMSFASSHGSNKMTTASGRKMSYSQVPTASLSSQLPPGSVGIRPDLFSQSGSREDSTSKPHFHIPKFRPVTDLSVLNNETLLKKNFYNPGYMATRYSTFLQILYEHHLSDPMNFAAVRDHSLKKFINRHSISHIERKKSRVIKSNGDIRYYEGLISYELLQCRSFLRNILDWQSRESPEQVSTITCEELLQINFINYVRYLLSLPNVLPVAPEKLDEILAKHYHFRSFFSEMSSALYSLKKESYADDMTTPSSDVDILVDTISKVSFEFILLEKYAIHILVKLNNNSIIENRIRSHLFSLYDLNMKLEKKESLKILNFNTFFSAQYSWYLAITMPFVRVFESNIYGEDLRLISDHDAYQKHLAKCGMRRDFKDSDSHLYKEYFSRLNFKDYELYVHLSRKDLVELQRNLNSVSDKFAGQTFDNGGFAFQYKPPNFEYYTNSLSSLETETFHVIHSRDILRQLSPNNFKVILSEFHRLLKKGGVLELPILESGDDQIQDLARSRLTGFPNLSKYLDLEVLCKLDIVPHYLQSLLEELSNVFGPKNVRFSPVLLSAKNDMNNFLIKHNALTFHETLGDINTYCSRFANEEQSSTEDEGDTNFYFYIRAEKS